MATTTDFQYNVDTSVSGTRPTATIVLADTSLTLGETTTVTIAFSEHVNGFDATDVNLTDANGTLGALTANADGKTWTATFTPTGDTQDATNTISVNLAGVTNDTGRTGAGNATSSNYTVDTTRPTATITLADRTLTAGETTIVTITFSKPVTDFDANDIVLSDANGTLGPLTTNANYTVWTATFTPTANVNDATNTIRVNLSGVTDAAGNAGVGNASSANYTVDTRDTTPPALASATVNGNQLVLTYTETNSLDAAALAGNAGFAVSSAAGTAAITVNSAVVNGAAKTVTLTLSRTVAHAETVRVSYTKPATGAVVQDAAGNDAANFSDQAVTNNTPADTTPPQLITTGDTTRPKVNGDQLVLSFDDTSNLDANPDHKPAGGAFTVLVNGVANAVTSVSVEAQAKTVTLTLSTAVSHGQTVTVAYADPTTGNDANAIQDAAGNDAASFAATAVTNNTPAPADTTPPQLITTGDTTRPKVTGNQLVLSFSDTGNLDGDPIHKPASGAFTVLVNGVANAVTTVTVQSRAKTVTLTLSTAV
ncbi:SwmB domain-containing protein, partial [Verminephrobacter aporrectodeae]